MELSGKQLGIVGYGKVGRLVSDRMKSFGMSIAFMTLILMMGWT